MKKFVIREKEKDSESDYSYIQKQCDNGITMTTPFPKEALSFKSRGEAELYCKIKKVRREQYIIKSIN